MKYINLSGLNSPKSKGFNQLKLLESLGPLPPLNVSQPWNVAQPLNLPPLLSDNLNCDSTSIM